MQRLARNFTHLFELTLWVSAPKFVHFCHSGRARGRYENEIFISPTFAPNVFERTSLRDFIAPTPTSLCIISRPWRWEVIKSFWITHSVWAWQLGQNCHFQKFDYNQPLFERTTLRDFIAPTSTSLCIILRPWTLKVIKIFLISLFVWVWQPGQFCHFQTIFEPAPTAERLAPPYRLSENYEIRYTCTSWQDAQKSLLEPWANSNRKSAIVTQSSNSSPFSPQQHMCDILKAWRESWHLCATSEHSTGCIRPRVKSNRKSAILNQSTDSSPFAPQQHMCDILKAWSDSWHLRATSKHSTGRSRPRVRGKSPSTAGCPEVSGGARARSMLLAALIIFFLLPKGSPFWRSQHAPKLTKFGTHARSGEKFYNLQSFPKSAIRRL